MMLRDVGKECCPGTTVRAAQGARPISRLHTIGPRGGMACLGAEETSILATDRLIRDNKLLHDELSTEAKM